MATGEISHREEALARSTRDVMEVFATSAQIAFPRTFTDRALREAMRAIPGEDAQAWTRRLVEVGESLNLRVRTITCTLDEALTFVGQGIPVAFCGDDQDGEPRWIVLREAAGRRVCVVDLDDEGDGKWIPVRRLPGWLGLESTASRAPWVIGQPALGCQASAHPSNHRSGEKRLTPLSRLIRLIRPEKRDLWIILIFSAVVGILALASPVAVEALVNTVAFGRYLQPVVILSVLLFTFLAFAAAMRGLITYVVEVFQRRLFIRVVEDLTYRLPRVCRLEWDRVYGPELANRFFDVVTLQKAASALLLDGVSIVLQTIVGMALLGFYHPFLLGFDVVLLSLIGFTVFGLGRGAVTTAVKESGAKYAVAAWLEELTRHPTAFTMHAGHQFAIERADQLAVNWLDARRAHFRVVLRQILFALGFQALAATALLGLGGWLVILGELTLGQLVAAELIVMVIVGSFAKLGKHMENFYDLLASVDKLGVLFDLKTEAYDRLFHLPSVAPAAVSARGVSYGYGDNAAIRNVSLELVPGEAVALVGQAGSGKSTLIDLLCGVRSPSSGHVELDGIDLRELRPDSLREHLAIARSTEIFRGTIDENVLLYRPHISALDVREALEAVGLLDELLKLPEGLNTPLQTDGSPLTSSQATRLMLARAVVGRPRLLLIDGTLDGLSDKVVAEVLGKLTGDGVPWTLLVATGRQAVIEACDRVVSLDATGIGEGREVSPALT